MDDLQPSRIIECELERDAAGNAVGAQQKWTFDNDDLVPATGNAQRLANGNTLICNGFRILSMTPPTVQPEIIEVSGGPNPEVVFEMTLDKGIVGVDDHTYTAYRAYRVPSLSILSR